MKLIATSLDDIGQMVMRRADEYRLAAERAQTKVASGEALAACRAFQEVASLIRDTEFDVGSPESYISDGRQQQLIELAWTMPASIVRQTIRETVRALRTGVPSPPAPGAPPPVLLDALCRPGGGGPGAGRQ